MTTQKNLHFLKRYAFIAFISHMMCFLSTSCSNGDWDEIPEYAPSESFLPVTQNPLPIGNKQLRILAIGNSYSVDATAYIDDIMGATDINPKDYCVYTVSRGSASLEYWANMLNSDELIWTVRQAGALSEITYPKNHGTISEFINHPWDIIVLQQYSQIAIDYDTYNPHLTKILSYIQEHCPNKDVAIAWQIIPTYHKNSSNNKGISGVERWKKIVDATKEMTIKNGINIIIPNGTAIQMARNSSLETDYDLTRDYIHLCYGIGRYIAACTWVETLFRPVFGVTIEGNKGNHELTEEELNDTNDGFNPSSSVAVDDSNRELCQQIALKACRSPYSLE